MKRLFYFVLSLVVVAGLIGGGIWFMRSKSKPIATNQAPQETSTAQSLLVTPLSAQVQLAYADRTDTFFEIQGATPAPSGTRIKTSATGRAIVEGTNTTIIDSNSELTLTNVDTEKNQTSLKLEAGQVWSRVKKLSDKGEFYEIETQNARASVRGTSFGVSKRGTDSWLFVVEGAVRYVPLDLKTHEEITSRIVIVPAGSKGHISEQGDVVVSIITDADKRDAWFVFNNSSQQPTSQQSSTSSNAPASSTPSASSTSPDTSVSSPTQRTISGTVAPSTDTSVSSTPPAIIAIDPIISTPPAIKPNKTISPGTPDSPELLISSVTPNSIQENTATRFTIKGSGFQKAQVTSVTVGKTSLTNFSVVDDTTISVSVSLRTLFAGTYDVAVIGASQLSSSLLAGLTVTPAL